MTVESRASEKGSVSIDDRELDAHGAAHWALSRPDVEALLGAYLVGTQGVVLGRRLDLADVPEACLKHLLKAKSAGRFWVVWSTEQGPMAAWGDYDPDRSQRVHAHVLFVEWWGSSIGHHRLWARSDPKRPTDWTFGRGYD